MRYLTTFRLFETIDDSKLITIEELLKKFGIHQQMQAGIIDWWKINRGDFKILYFPFQTSHPIAGVFLGEDTIVVNSKGQMPPHMRLFLALHESRHCDQHRDGNFIEGYFNSVVRGDKSTFLMTYRDLETDANDFAIQSMRDLGFVREMNSEESRLRSNEGAGEMVYRMMTADIEKFKPVDFFHLLEKQIGL